MEGNIVVLAASVTSIAMTREEYCDHIGVEDKYKRGNMEDKGFLVTFVNGEDVEQTWMSEDMFNVCFDQVEESETKEQGILRYFAYAHLPAGLQLVSKPIGIIAKLMHSVLPEGAEKSAGMRKLLEAKDCFVRAALDK